MGERNYRLTLAYDGTRYRGWQRLEQAELTVQGKLESVLTAFFGTPGPMHAVAPRRKHK